MEGKTALGASSPAKPALHMPEPLSTTRAAASSSHILAAVVVVQDICEADPRSKKTGIVLARHTRLL